MSCPRRAHVSDIIIFSSSFTSGHVASLSEQTWIKTLTVMIGTSDGGKHPSAFQERGWFHPDTDTKEEFNVIFPVIRNPILCSLFQEAPASYTMAPLIPVQVRPTVFHLP